MLLPTMPKYFLGSLLLLASALPSQAKVLILTFSYNKPEFIELQYKTFKKFLQDDHELIVFNDAYEEKMASCIHKICQKYSIKCIPIPQEIHDMPYLDRSTEKADLFGSWTYTEYHAPSVLYSNIAQYALDSFGFNHDDIVVIFESDLFLVKEFSFHEYLKGHDLAGYNRQVDYHGAMRNVPFLWIGLIMMDMKSLPNKLMFNLNCGFYNNILYNDALYNDVIVDCGGYTYDYIKYNLDARIKYFQKVEIQNNYCQQCELEKNYQCNHNTLLLNKLGFDDRTIQFIQQVPIDWGSGVIRPNGIEGLGRRNMEFFVDNHFVHFCGATGYANSSTTPNVDIKQFHKDKTDAFLSYIKDIIKK